ncbi:carbon monoxide dehydrogenase medium chain [Variibacter gotjawalensis]|uniref:Carbon monoxide dehydrogenase medium chain n=1 Tax=Variibacter gotjawalensis TaxID=1333996 RepID=A0A0S3PQF3_9BRAD|nr:FAD binding domain-containing protein [Variibacter gotjawalensis]NIK48409.1 carbon-monoxide dehydrogenase medium subunit [Variibacter gotjawalensis]RZS50276.1 carbon-monoxide dehydrogenase medium subunit [Variibacter gotjawalensis]BAT58109.1 carbon monoxide dehydrogenase medium chain [Variibacter gotjawalensis]
MKPASFVYHAPKTVDEAVALLAETAADDGRILAGGQSLVPTMAFRMARPGHLVDINGIAEIAKIETTADALVIGAGVRHAAFHQPVTKGPLGKLLAFVVRHIAHYPIRQRGTFCGSLAHADPSSEWCLTAATLGATMVVRNADGSREIAAEDFFQGIMTTALEEGDMLVAARLPLLSADTHHGFYEFSRRAGDYAMAAALTTYRIENGVMTGVRLGLGGAEASPRRMAEAEAELEGKAPSDKAFRAAAEAAAEAIDPLEDLQADAAFRRDLVRAVARRALERASGAKVA